MARLSRPVPPTARRLATALLTLLLWFLVACSSGPTPIGSTTSQVAELPSATEPASPSAASSPLVSDRTATDVPPAWPDAGSAAAATTSTAPSPVRQGTVASSERVRFVPAQIELPSGHGAGVDPEPTVDGVLQIPADISRVGWWDGSAEAGDPFGSTVIAGHVDSRVQGLGFFAELLVMQVGDVITLRSPSDELTYRVVAVTLVSKQALAADDQTLNQRGPHRLVLITCSGQWHPEVRSYDSNLIITAEPAGR